MYASSWLEDNSPPTSSYKNLPFLALDSNISGKIDKSNFRLCFATDSQLDKEERLAS
jgi:hypothetical protein